MRNTKERIKDDPWGVDLGKQQMLVSWGTLGTLGKQYIYSGREERVLSGQIVLEMPTRRKRGEPSRLLGL